MHPFIRISRVWSIKAWIKISVSLSLISLFSIGCASRAPSLRVLDTRAGYGSELDDEEVALYQRARKSQDSLLYQGGRRIVSAYIYPHELPTKDYFWGAYVSLIVGETDVTFEDPNDIETGPAIKAKKKGKIR